MQPVANHPFEASGFEPTFGPQMYQLVFTAAETRRKGCFACGWRRKKCTPVGGIAPSPSNPCAACAKFNILCYGRGLKRPPGKALAKAVCAVLKLWIADKRNWKRHHPFDLAPYYGPPASATWVVDPNPTPIVHVIQEAEALPPTPNEPIIGTTVEDDLTRVLFYSSYAEGSTSQGGTDNGQTQSSLPYFYTLHSSPSGEHQGYHPNCSPAWENIDYFSFRASNHCGFETLGVCNCDRYKSGGVCERTTLL